MAVELELILSGRLVAVLPVVTYAGLIIEDSYPPPVTSLSLTRVELLAGSAYSEK